LELTFFGAAVSFTENLFRRARRAAPCAAALISFFFFAFVCPRRHKLSKKAATGH